MSLTHTFEKLLKYSEPYYTAEAAHEYGVNFESREIFLFGRDDGGEIGDDGGALDPGVDYMMANQFIKNMRLLQVASQDPILIHMNTPGGFWEHGMAIYQAIKSSPNHITILNYAQARSMSSIIFLAADWRVMLPYGQFMVHYGSHGAYGTHTQFQTEAEQGKLFRDQMMGIYVEALREAPELEGKTDKQIENWLEKQMQRKEEVYFSAERAVELNFADMVFGIDGTYDWARLKAGWNR